MQRLQDGLESRLMCRLEQGAVLTGRESWQRMLRDAGAPHRTSPGTAAACGCKYQCKGCLLVLQVTAAHTGVGKGHLKLDLNLVSQRSHLGSAAHRDGLCTLSNTPKTTEPSPFSFSITFTHKEIRFKGQN